MRIRYAAGAAGLVVAVLLAGCDSGPQMADVTGTVTVDGKTPAEGSSISFIPTDGKGPTAGDTIKDGKYSARVPVGMNRVEIRAPRPAAKGKAGAGPDGPGPGSGGWIEESLPDRYHEKSDLTFEVKPGKNEKNWETFTTK